MIRINLLGQVRPKSARRPVDTGAALPADRRELHVRPVPSRDIVALTSRSHLERDTEALLSALPLKERRAIGSSLKFCLIAEGEGDVYPSRSATARKARAIAAARSSPGVESAPSGRPNMCAPGKAPRQGFINHIAAESALQLATGTSRLGPFCERFRCRS